MARNWTPKQNEAIMKEGDLLVSAAAGAGKTAVLTERIARLISEGCGVDRLLVVTFTRAAASEMKDRISARLKALSDEAAEAGDMQKAASLTRASAAAESANISTIHSFCTSVLRRNYHEAGIDPSVRVAEQLDAELFAARAMGEIIEEAFLANEKEKDPGFEQLLAAVGSADALEELIRSLYRFTVARPDPEEWLDKAVLMYTEDFASAAKAAADDLIGFICEELQIFFDTAKALRRGAASEHPHIAAALDDDMSFYMSLMLRRDYDEWVRAIGGYSFTRLTWNRGTDEAEKEEVKAYREAFKKYHAGLKKRFSHTLSEEAAFAKLLSRPVAALRKLVTSFIERYASIKEEEGVIDFADMEQLTLKVLRNFDIAREYRERFLYVFVDEYQDINPVQEAILSAVSDGNRFMVGDVKQSIYRFRQAEPAIFLEKYRTYDGAGGRSRIDLNSNFRSRAAILDAANLLFSQLMRGGTVGEIDYSDNAELVSGFPDEERVGSVELTLIDPDPEGRPTFPFYGDEEDDSAEDASKASLQAAYAAERILGIMENETLIENGAERRYRWSDFTILLRSVSPVASEWLNALSDAGIPCLCDNGPGFFEAIEVRLFIDLLRVIDNRRQDVPLLAVMRSAIFGFTDEELIHIKADYEGEAMLDRVIAAAADPSAPTWSVKAADMLSRIDSWRRLMRIKELGELVCEVLDETKLSIYVSSLFGGEARQTNLETLVALAARFATEGKGSLNAFIRFLDDSRESSPASAAASPAVDAVRLMTIHHSKGLEFPVVILGDITKRFNRASNSAVGIFDAELGIGLCSVSGDRGNKSLLQRAMSFREQRRQNAEEMRMLYVAQTRAREKLIMLGVQKNSSRFCSLYARPLDGVRVMNASSYAEWMLGAYFPAGVETPAPLPCGAELALTIRGARAVRAARAGMSEDEFALWQQEAAFADTSGLDELFRTHYAGAADTSLPSKLSVTGLTLRVPEVHLRPRFMEDEGEATGAEIGTLTHRLLQLIPIMPHTEESVKDALASLTARGLFTEREAGLVDVRHIVRFFGSDLGRRLIRSPKVEREKEFDIMIEASRLIGGESDTPIMLQGVIDCCFMEDGEWILVDHKTTHVDKTHSPRTVAERYREQLGLYKTALERLTKVPVREEWVYLLSADEAVKL